ncbi:NAD-dependent DNA ligase LigA, partial [Methylobacterium sp. WL18]|uniref:BRCT domain-containing protein n=1 Tax=Methylobacterium sp. WL18 TaxID=2603897 RepID=UPI0011D80EE3
EALSAERRAEAGTTEPPKKATKKKGDEDDKAIKNLLAGVEARRSVPMNRLLFALGIPQIGEATAKALAKRFSDMPSLIAAITEAAAVQPGPDWVELRSVDRIGDTTRDRLLDLGFPDDAPSDAPRARLSAPQRENLLQHYGDADAVRAALARAAEQKPGDAYRLFADDGEIGPVATDALILFFSEPHNADAVNALLEQVTVEPMERPAAASAFAGQTVVFTGTLEKMTRNEAKAVAERLGAKVSGSVSAKTDLVVAGPGAGSKLKDAEKHGVRVVSEDDWLGMVAHG